MTKCEKNNCEKCEKKNCEKCEKKNCEKCEKNNCEKCENNNYEMLDLKLLRRTDTEQLCHAILACNACRATFARHG